jgi:hypothetical protein
VTVKWELQHVTVHVYSNDRNPCFAGSVRLVGRDVELELVLALKKIKVRIEALP